MATDNPNSPEDAGSTAGDSASSGRELVFGASGYIGGHLVLYEAASLLTFVVILLATLAAGFGPAMAVRGMLPKNRLGRAMFRKLKVYAGPEHKHTAQQPKQLEI